jgi:hypothetical protein
MKSTPRVSEVASGGESIDVSVIIVFIIYRYQGQFITLKDFHKDISGTLASVQ